MAYKTLKKVTGGKYVVKIPEHASVSVTIHFLDLFHQLSQEEWLGLNLDTFFNLIRNLSGVTEVCLDHQAWCTLESEARTYKGLHSDILRTRHKIEQIFKRQATAARRKLNNSKGEQDNG